MKLSLFGTALSTETGIGQLMDDLGEALDEEGMIMMGGGNPGHVPEIQSELAQGLIKLASQPECFRNFLGIYHPPSGDKGFRQHLAALFHKEYGWELSEENICLTQGSQTAFFLLFNMLAGKHSDGVQKKILLPMAPEYIGYADLGLSADMFVSVRPRIDVLEDNLFKYRVDFDKIHIDEQIAAICVSRPTNPSGNVLTDEEMDQLAALAAEHDIPLIIDNAYGMPFPDMVYTQATPLWNKHCILGMSLSKFGLPGVRTGIMIAAPEVIRAITAINSLTCLAPNSLGPMLVDEITRTGRILTLSREVVRPFYRAKREKALHWAREFFQGVPCRIHLPEGAMFLWLWFPDLPFSSRELYQRLKQRKVLVVAGEYFFPGLPDDWQHSRECIRLTYSQDDDDIKEGLARIADEVRSIYQQHGLL